MKYKVIQWATGAMGKTALRAVIDHPGLELVGLFVYSPKKVGVDAGKIANRADTAVLATNNIDDILALEADVVLHMAQIQSPYSCHNDDICRLLASGKNLISINGHSYPQYWGEDYLDKFTAACEQGQSTLLGSGLNPGYITEKIATLATSICLEVSHVEVTEIVDCRKVQNPNYVFDMLGFGSPCDKINPNDPKWPPAEILTGMYSEVVAHLVKRLGYQLERVETDHILYPASSDIEMAAGLIKQGTVSHTNWRWHGIVDGKPLVTLSIHWIMENAHLDDPDYSIWGIKVKGLPEIDISVDLGTPEGHPYKTTAEQYGVAGSLINSIPGLIGSPSGIREVPLSDVHWPAA